MTTGYGVAYNPNPSSGDAYWVAVGYDEDHSIVYSTDPSGNSWVAGSANFFTTGRAVAWTGTWWVATGDGGAIAYSTDGINWSNFNYNLISGLADNPSNYISSVKWNGIYWVATGFKNTDSNGCLLYSVDGKYWTETLDSKFLTYIDSINAIGWTSNVSNINIKHPIVAVGTGTNSPIAYSMDGYKWINVGAGIFTTGYAVAWNGTMWVAVGAGSNSIAYSYDGLNWVGLGTSIVTSGDGKCIAWNGTMWFAGFTDGTLAYSYNGVIWSIVSSSGLTSCNAIVWNGIQWCAGGDATSNPIITSTDGLTWTQQTNSLTSCNDIKSNGQLWIAVGTNGIIYSYDSNTWYAIAEVTFAISAVAWNGKMWVAGGASSANNLLYSANGIAWTSLTNTIFATSCTAIAWTGDKWIVGGLNGTAALFKTSYNGTVWYLVTWSDPNNKQLNTINGIAGNPRIGPTILDSQLVLNSNGTGLDNTLDVVSGKYYQSGYTNMETTVYTTNA
ncbi:MAG: hypothetical protein EBR59_09985 [Methylococcaceae bacterium]|nr:hypothetical protein [Methylococcaceae bacterium]